MENKPRSLAEKAMIIEPDMCRNCRSWNHLGEGRDDGVDKGECRFDPPRVFLTVLHNPGCGPEGEFITGWPTTRPDYWCRKHEKKTVSVN